MDRLILRDVAPTPLERALPLLAACASPFTGIAPVARRGASPAVFAATVARGLVRYAGAFPAEDRIRVGSADEFGDAAARPESFALFHPDQYALAGFPYARFERATRLRWTPAYRLPDGSRAFVPAQLLAFGRAFHGEPRLDYSTEVGVACAPTFEEAVLAGLFALVAHDAFMLTWRAMLSLPLIARAGEQFRAAFDGFDRGQTAPLEPARRRSSSIVDLSAINDIPTALVVVRDAAGVRAAACASAPTLESAARQALQAAETARPPVDRQPTRCATFIDGSPRRVDPAAREPLAGRSVGGQIVAVLAQLALRGVEVYVVDTTPPDLRSAGLRTAAVLAPQLCRFDWPGRTEHLGGRRLYDAAHGAGLVGSPLQLDGLNRLPLPAAPAAFPLQSSTA